MNYATVRAVHKTLEFELNHGSITQEMAGDAFGRMLPRMKSNMTGKDYSDIMREVRAEHLERARGWEI